MASSSDFNKEELIEWVKKARQNAPQGFGGWDDYKTGYSDAMGEILEQLTGELIAFV